MIPILNGVDRLSAFVGKLFGWLILVMVVVIIYEVFLRYVLRTPTAWAYDVGYMLYGAIFVMAGAYALSVAAHVRGDVIYRLWRPRTQAAMDLLLYLVFFFPAIIALVYAGYNFAEFSWRIGERSSSGPGGPPVYHFKTLIPIAAAFLFIQGLAEVARCVMCLRDGVWPPRLSDVQEVDVEAAKRMLEDADINRAPAPACRPMMGLTNPEVGILMLGMLIFLILLGFPIAFTLIAMAVGFGYYAIGPAIFNLLVQRTYGVMSNQVLIAVPLFLFMGYMVERANILDKLFGSLQLATRHVPGSLAVASLITCALFATATGIVGAVVTLMGLLALPAMLNAGYDRKLSAGVICAGGCLGILIPPSIMLILYGATSGRVGGAALCGGAVSRG
jgi:TRAP-type mannitol/chloroaromatic compound transport system permease small subunit